MSSESSSCRIDWRPSRLLCVALAGLGGLGAISIALADLPLAARLPLAAFALLHGLQLARREWQRPRCRFELHDGEPALMREAGARPQALAAPRLSLRGALLATIAWRAPDGSRQSRTWCADTLPVAARRQLRLHSGGHSPA